MMKRLALTLGASLALSGCFGGRGIVAEAVAVYDATLARTGGGVVTRRFEARVPVAAPDAANVAPALNQTANQIAAEVAAWIGTV